MHNIHVDNCLCGGFLYNDMDIFNIEAYKWASIKILSKHENSKWSELGHFSVPENMELYVNPSIRA